MMKFFKSLPFHFKSAGQSLVRHAAMTFSSSTAVTVTLTLFMLLLVVAGNVANFANGVEESLMIHATIEGTVQEEQIQDIQKEIQEMEYVKKVTFSSKEEELESYLSNQDPESAKLYEIYQGEANPLLNAFIVEVKNGAYLEQVNQKIQKIEGIHDSQFGGDSASMLIKALDGIRFGGAVFIVALGVLAIFLISNTIKSAIYARNNEIAIMRQVGATNGFIKMPFMIEGMVIGILGSILPMLLTVFGYRYLYRVMNGQLFMSMFKLQPVSPFVWIVCGILMITGIIVGITGSFFAVNKYLRWKR